MTPLKAIRAKCLDCCCGQANEVKQCTVESCPLWPLRFGKGPKKDLTDEQRLALAIRMKNLRNLSGKNASN